MLTTLRHRDFALLWTGGLISFTGNRMLSTALPYYVYVRTGSTLATATMVLMAIVPVVLVGSFSGVYVDRWDLKRLLVGTNLIHMALMGVLMLGRNDALIGLVYAVILLQALVNTFQDPAETTLLPRLVGPERLLSANALNSLNNDLARLIGPPLGGLLLGWLGLEAVVVVNGITFLAAALLMALITRPEATPHGGTSHMGAVERWRAFWMEWGAGLRLIGSQKFILTLLLVLGATSLAGTMLSPLYPAFAEAILEVGPLGFGWILTAQALGGILGGLLIGQWGQSLSAVWLLAWGNVLVALLLFLQFNIPVFPIALGVAFLIGPEQVAVNVGLQTLLQRAVPVALQGRVFGAMGTANALFSLVGAAAAGPLGQLVGIVPTLNVAAGITLMVGLGAAVVLPRMESPLGASTPG